MTDELIQQAAERLAGKLMYADYQDDRACNAQTLAADAGFRAAVEALDRTAAENECLVSNGPCDCFGCLCRAALDGLVGRTK